MTHHDDEPREVTEEEFMEDPPTRDDPEWETETETPDAPGPERLDLQALEVHRGELVADAPPALEIQSLDGPLAKLAQKAMEQADTFEEALEIRLKMVTDVARVRDRYVRSIYDLCLAATFPEHWVLFRDENGNETAHLKAPGAQKLRPLVGAGIRNLRNRAGDPIHAPEVYLEDDDKSKTAFVAFDGHVQQPFPMDFPAMSFARNSKEGFIGRGATRKATKVVGELDLQKACYTGAWSHLIRSALGLSRVPLDEFRARNWTEEQIARMSKGGGYGSAERGAEGAAAAAKATPTGDPSKVSTKQVKLWHYRLGKRADELKTDRDALAKKVLGRAKIENCPKDKFNDVLSKLDQ